jgi:release factor glutamine methyltransferase
MTISTSLVEATKILSAAGINTARLDGLILLEETLGRDRSWLLAHPEQEFTIKQARRFRSNLRRRSAREPLAYITGKAWFYGLQFSITPDVLIPRPETELLVETVLSMADHSSSILEIGTGSGAIAISLQVAMPSLHIVATDVSTAALTLARQNAKQLGLQRLQFKQANLSDGVREEYDILVANLPYLAKDAVTSPEAAWEPDMALYGGVDGLDLYRQLFKQLSGFMPAPPHVVLEAEPAQQRKLVHVAKEAGYQLQSLQNFCYHFTLASNGI